MKWLVYSVLFIVAFFLFVPTTTSGEIRNLPLLIALIGAFILFWLIRYIRTFVFAMKTALLLKKQSFRITKAVLLFQTAYLVAEGEECVYNICLYRGINRKYRYHFEKSDVLEIYKTTRETYSGAKRNVDGAHGPPIRMADKVFSGETMTKLAKRKKFLHIKPGSDKPVYRMVLLSEFPIYISDSITDRSRDPIDEGETICGSETVVCSLDGLRAFFDRAESA